jgi:hypothetical protein
MSGYRQVKNPKRLRHGGEYEPTESELCQMQSAGRRISTGTDDGSIASHLVLYYVKTPRGTTNTIVVTEGEYENALPVRYRGKIKPRDALISYLHEVEEEDE